MVEMKSVRSLANTSFIAVLPSSASRDCKEQSDQAIRSSLVQGCWTASLPSIEPHRIEPYRTPAYAAEAANFARRCFGYHFVKYTAVLRSAKAIASPDHSGRPGA